MQTLDKCPRGMTMAEVRALLPKVGDVLMERPTVDGSAGHEDFDRKPQRCVVVDVQPNHLWYTVQFENGIRESYKLPRRKPGKQGGIL